MPFATNDVPLHEPVYRRSLQRWRTIVVSARRSPESSVSDAISSGETVAELPVPACVTRWQFVYLFFSNGTPFDSPNRSEPCLIS